MAGRVRFSWSIAAVTMGVALGALGCDAGGLLVMETKGNPRPKVEGANATEIVSGGRSRKTASTRSSTRWVKPSPQSRTTNTDKTFNGGVVGASQGP